MSIIAWIILGLAVGLVASRLIPEPRSGDLRFLASPAWAGQCSAVA